MNVENIILLAQIILLALCIFVGFYWSSPRIRQRLKVGVYSPWIIVPFIALFSAYTGDFTPELGLVFFLIALSFSSLSAFGLFISSRNKKRI